MTTYLKSTGAVAGLGRTSRRLLTAAALGIVALGTSAQANGVPTIIPSVGPAKDPWTGAWVGAGLGWGSSNYDLRGNFDFGGGAFGTYELPDLGGQGGLATIEAGYGFRFGTNMVAALQVDYTRTGITNRTAFDAAGGAVTGEYELVARDMLTGAARVGFLPSESTQIYGLIGATRGTFRGSYELVGALGDPADNYSFRMNGLTLGLGIETMVTDNMSVKVEYRNTRFRTRDVIDFAPVFDMNMRTNVQSFRVVGAYRF